jgi:putative salt-induced outer membrane protein YdiY
VKYIFDTYFNLNLTKMKKVKLIFGLLALVIFSLSFVMNDNSNTVNDKEQAIKKNKTRGIPSNG